jgi:hypothetical protein
MDNTTPHAAVQILRAARGMLYLHDSQPPILHRDLERESPNLLVDEAGRVKVSCHENLAQMSPYEMDCPNSRVLGALG